MRNNLEQREKKIKIHCSFNLAYSLYNDVHIQCRRGYWCLSKCLPRLYLGDSNWFCVWCFNPYQLSSLMFFKFEDPLKLVSIFLTLWEFSYPAQTNLYTNYSSHLIPRKANNWVFLSKEFDINDGARNFE